MIGEWIRKRTAGLFMALGGIVARLGISANVVTLFGLALSGLAAYFIAVGLHLTAGIVLIAAGLLDGLDGSVARMSGAQTAFGAFWDSIIDRFSESVTLFGVLLFYLNEDVPAGVMLSFIAVVSSLLVSYTRARAEGLGIYFRGGMLTRLERVVLLIAGLLVGRLLIVMWALAILSTFTVLQRIYLTWSALQHAQLQTQHNNTSAES